MPVPYDAIVVGARVAGACTGLLLARSGCRVLVLDRAAIGSDTICAHRVVASGVGALQAYGLFDSVVASGCPVAERTVLHNAAEPIHVAGTTLSPRRFVLDALLLESAAAAGAEVRPRFTVTDLVWDGDRVTGVVGHGPGGRSVVDSARIVIGADGRNSFVAETVRARRYEEHAGASCCYYAHWAGLAAAEPELHFTSCLAVGVHPTHDDLTCVTVTRPVRHWTRFKRAPEATYRAELQRIPALAERFGSARREGRFIGSADLGSCFRQAAGQGWVLVGDAGHYRDPLLGGGIADALVQAGLVSRVVANGLSGDDSLEEAVGAFGKLRDGAWRPLDNATRSVASFAWTQAELPDLLRREAEASAVILALVDKRGALG